MKNGRSPLKSPPLHNPGESLQQQRDNLIYEELLPYLIMSLFLILWASFAWLDQLGIISMRPDTLTLLALLGLVVSTVKFFRIRKRVREHNRGLEAEKAVGQFLEQFRANDYVVFHDVPGKNFNIDHVLIGPKGVFTIETKGRTKPQKGECKIVYDGQHVLVNGYAPERNPITQAKAQASWLKAYLQGCTNQRFDVTPLVVFPGWYVDYSQARNALVRVTTEKLIWPCIQSSRNTLSPDDTKLAGSRLAIHIQNYK